MVRVIPAKEPVKELAWERGFDSFDLALSEVIPRGAR
jgi:hypothetical protein